MPQEKPKYTKEDAQRVYRRVTELLDEQRQNGYIRNKDGKKVVFNMTSAQGYIQKNLPGYKGGYVTLQDEVDPEPGAFETFMRNADEQFLWGVGGRAVDAVQAAVDPNSTYAQQRAQGAEDLRRGNEAHPDAALAGDVVGFAGEMAIPVGGALKAGKVATRVLPRGVRAAAAGRKVGRTVGAGEEVLEQAHRIARTAGGAEDLTKALKGASQTVDDLFKGGSRTRLASATDDLLLSNRGTTLDAVKYEAGQRIMHLIDADDVAGIAKLAESRGVRQGLEHLFGRKEANRVIRALREYPRIGKKEVKKALDAIWKITVAGGASAAGAKGILDLVTGD